MIEKSSFPWSKFLVPLLLLLALSVRAPLPKADPPVLLPSLSGSAGIYFDEGIYSHNARNRILFGQWVTDDWNPLLYNAVLTGAYYGAFRLFGVSMATVKGLNILFGLLSILLFLRILRRFLPPSDSLLLTLPFAFDFYFAMYNRLGLLENFSSLIFLLTFLLFLEAKRREPLFFVVGVCAALAGLSKYLFLSFALATLLSVLYHSFRQHRLRPLLLFLAGALSLFLLWGLLIYLPFRESFSRIGHGWGVLSLPRTSAQLLGNLIHQPLARYLVLVPLPGVISLLFLATTLRRLFRPKRLLPEGETIFLALWILAIVLEMALLNYRPLRYYLPLFPALYLTLPFLLKEKGRGSFWDPFLWLSLLLLSGLLPLLLNPPSAFFLFPSPLRWTLYLSLPLVLLLPLNPFQRRLGILFSLLPVAFSLFLFLNHFLLHPTYSLERASLAIKSLPPGSVILGQEAPRLALETPFRTYMAYDGWFNDRAPFSRFKPTHLLVLDKFGGAEMAWMERRGYLKEVRLKKLRTFPVWDSTVSLYRVDPLKP